jgi:hypothetical protein
MRLLQPKWSMTGVALLTAAALLGGCKRATPPPTAAVAETPASTPASAPAPILSDAESRYGVSPKLDPRVTYQPNVIVMEHGAEAIRAPTADGFTWTLDGAAQGASSIEAGKILFATGRVVGRVLKVERKGSDFAVTLGPIELTDVIKEAHIDYSGPIDPATMLVYPAPAGYPGTTLDRNAPEPAATDTTAQRMRYPSMQVLAAYRPGHSRATRSGFAGYRLDNPCAAEEDGAPAPFAAMSTVYFDGPANPRAVDGCDRTQSPGRFLHVSTGISDIAAILMNGFQIVPDVSKGLGATINYDFPQNKNIKFVAHARLRLDSPRFTFKLDISNGRLKTAAVELAGVGALDVGIEGGTYGAFKNVNQAFAIPLDISFPMPVIVPFAATFHQSILIETMFTAQQAVIKANGEYKFGGTVTAGIVNGSATATAPLFVSTEQNLANSLTGVSLGVNGLVIGYGGKFIVGLGALGLVVGPYASINISAGMTKGSDAQGPMVGYTCRSATLDLFMDYGVGMAIPTWSASAINTFLSIFHAKPISSTYSNPLGHAPIKTLYDAVPQGCAKKPEAS